MSADPADCPPEAAEYFAAFTGGRYDETCQLRFVYTAAEARLSDDGEVFFVGRPGADGLEFAVRRGHPGVWIWYPIDDEWRRVSPDLASLERDWRSGKLPV